MNNILVSYQFGYGFGIGVAQATGDARGLGATGAIESVGPNLDGGDGSFELVRITSTSELEDHLGISASVSGSVGLFSASAKFSFASSTKVQTSSIFLLLKCTKTFGFQHIPNPNLTPEAATLVQNGNAGLFYDKYGNYFISGISSGGEFYGMIQVDTKSQEDHESMSASLSASYGPFNAEASTNLSNALTQTNSALKVGLTYSGGNVTKTPTTPQELLAAKDEWEKSVVNQAKPTLVLLMPWVIANGPNPPNSADLDKQQAVLANCAKLRSQALDYRNMLGFILDNQTQFQFDSGSADIAKIGTWRALNDESYDIIAQAASYAINNVTKALDPEPFAQQVLNKAGYQLFVLDYGQLPKNFDKAAVPPPPSPPLPPAHRFIKLADGRGVDLAFHGRL